MHKNIALSL